MGNEGNTPNLDTLQAPAWQRLVEPLARLAAPGADDEDFADKAPNSRPRERAGAWTGATTSVRIAGRADERAPEPGRDPGLFVPLAHRERFMHAGLRDRSAPVVFYASKLGLAVGTPLLVWLGLGLAAKPMAAGPMAALLLGSALLGLQLPGLWLNRRIAQRQRAIFEAFPDAIDLMIVCIEAGLGIDAALERTGRDMAARCPALAEELDLLAAELRLGVARPLALKHLAARTGVDEVRAFATMLVHTERLGSGVADALRVHAQALRLKRERRAEEEAAKLPVKLLFPLIFTLFPALMVVLMGPAGLSLLRQLKSMAAGA